MITNVRVGMRVKGTPQAQKSLGFGKDQVFVISKIYAEVDVEKQAIVSLVPQPTQILTNSFSTFWLEAIKEHRYKKNLPEWW